MAAAVNELQDFSEMQRWSEPRAAQAVSFTGGRASRRPIRCEDRLHVPGNRRFHVDSSVERRPLGKTLTRPLSLLSDVAIGAFNAG